MILRVEQLCAGYANRPVLLGVELEVMAAEVVVILGSNGSGKSTLFKAICGLIPCERGTVRINGVDLTNARTEKILQSGLAYVPQDYRVFATLTVDENLELGGHLLPTRTARKERTSEIYKRFPMLAAKREEVAGNLSGGQQQILGIARSLTLSPQLLLLDEPSIGTDLRTLELLLTTIRELQRLGIAVLMIEQNIRVALSVATRILQLKSGLLINFSTQDLQDLPGVYGSRLPKIGAAGVRYP